MQFKLRELLLLDFCPVAALTRNRNRDMVGATTRTYVSMRTKNSVLYRLAYL